MLSILIVALLCVSGFIAGIASSASLVVHPVMMKISKPAAIEVFKPFFDITHKLVLSLSAMATVLALLISYLSGNWWWFGIALLMHLNGPYTLKFMMPTNHRLMANDIDPHSEQVATDLKNWGGLHAVRSVWNCVIFVLLLLLSQGMWF